MAQGRRVAADGEVYSVKLSKADVDAARAYARLRSLLEGQDIVWVDFLRAALADAAANGRRMAGVADLKAAGAVQPI